MLALHHTRGRVLPPVDVVSLFHLQVSQWAKMYSFMAANTTDDGHD